MMQIGDLQTEPQAFPNVLPAWDDKQRSPSRRLSGDEPEPLFVSPPPTPWPRVFPGL